MTMETEGFIGIGEEPYFDGNIFTPEFLERVKIYLLSAPEVLDVEGYLESQGVTDPTPTAVSEATGYLLSTAFASYSYESGTATQLYWDFDDDRVGSEEFGQ